VPQYRQLQQRIGTTRVVVVQPRNYATDNRSRSMHWLSSPRMRAALRSSRRDHDAELKRSTREASAASASALPMRPRER